MMDEKKLLKKDFNVRQLAYGMMAYTAGSILGPLVLFTGLGYFLDYILGTRPFFLIAGVMIAFIATNILILKKVNRLSKKFDQVEPKEEIKKKEE